MVFLCRLRDGSRNFIFKAIDKDNYTIAGRRGARELEEVDLYNGLYLVAAYNHQFIGHAIVLKVQGGKRLVFDMEETVSSEEDWIAIIRPFIVFKKL